MIVVFAAAGPNVTSIDVEPTSGAVPPFQLVLSVKSEDVPSQSLGAARSGAASATMPKARMAENSFQFSASAGPWFDFAALATFGLAGNTRP